MTNRHSKSLVLVRLWIRCVVAAAILGFGGCNTDRTNVSDPLPDLPNLAGERLPLFSTAKNRIAGVVIVMRTDCPIGNRYVPTIRSISERFNTNDQVEFVLVYPLETESNEQVRRHLSEFELDLPVRRDPGATFVRQIKAAVTPEAFVFDRTNAVLYRGRIDDRFVDFGQARPAATQHDLIDVLDAMLSGQRVPTRATEAVGCYLEDAVNR